MTGLGGGQRVAKDAPPGRHLRHGRRAELADRRGARDRPVRAPHDRARRSSRTSCSTSARTCAGRRTTRAAARIPTVEARHVEKLERLIDEFNDVVGPLTNFLLPGGVAGRGAPARRADDLPARRARGRHASARDEAIGEHVLPYLNRLSDALFVMARYENHERGVAEPLWQPGR